MGPEWVEPDEGDVGEGRRLDNGGDEKSEAKGAIRREETGEKEAQGEERRSSMATSSCRPYRGQVSGPDFSRIIATRATQRRA